MHNVVFVLVVFFLLSVRFYFFYENLPKYKDGQVIKQIFRIASESKHTDKIQSFVVRLPDGRAVYVVTKKYPFFNYGQNVEISGKLQINKENGIAFYSMSYPEIKQIEKESNFIFSLSLAIRNKAIKLFNSVLSPVHSALLSGIVFGIKLQMSDNFYNQLQSVGVLHVIAASGMNVSMVSGAVFYIFIKFLNRRIAIILSILFISMYTVIAGMEPSIVRAAIMAIFTFSAGLTGRQKLPYYILCLTAVIMLFYSPLYLSDVGFQLSFLATLGILYLKPIFTILNKGLIGVLIGEELATILSAQLATIPILLINFGFINLISVLVNTLILWTIPIITVFGAISIMLAYIFEPAAKLIVYLTLPFLWIFEQAVKYFAGIIIPIEVYAKSNIFWLGYYLVLASVVVFIHKNREGRT